MLKQHDINSPNIHDSDRGASTLLTDSDLVMAEQIAHDVVNEAQSAGVYSPSDDIATTPNDAPAGNGQAQHLSYIVESEASESVDGAENGVMGDLADGAELRLSESSKLEGGLAVQNENAAHALGDLSGGSDTDTSRADQKEEEKGHARTGSVKKPTMFKPVSVTKSFLAKSAAASPVVQASNKGIPASPSPTSALLSAKPRLVAKSALGGAAGSRLSKLNGVSGPDASKVWNKNRPVPPPPPRQFTDEELQTRYGIHMATRLQSDETGKDPKWADIDDDEDDWAPETVEWMDGTKSSVVAAETQSTPPPQAEHSPPPPTEEKPAESVKPVLATMQKPALPQTTKTILKPGAQLMPGQKPSLLQKSSSDKPALIAKNPAPTPAKSPWAPLPPVEKVSPVVINPPTQQPQRPFQRDPHGFDSLPPVPAQAKEIAADDFNRQWREDRGTKELFNAQSGRYEPAGDARRGSRQDHGHRQPAVLQRPSHGSQNGPAEPSAAFQSRSTADGWSRRRASSNLSAASGRRPSLIHIHDPSQPNDLPVMSPISGPAVESPKMAIASAERPSTTQGPWVRASQAAPDLAVAEGTTEQVNGQPPAEDPVAVQHRMMREKIERARLQKQREKEAEEAEAAAKKERLRLKMEALAAAAPSPELKETKSKESTAPAAGPPQQKAIASPPKPPVPTSKGEVAQYGMMKVHQPHPVRKNYISEASLTAKSQNEVNTDQSQGLRSPNKAAARPTHAAQQPPVTSTEKGLKRLSEAPPLDKVAGTWKSPSPQDSYNWGPNAMTMNARSAVGANVWGPPSNNDLKSLGNGTFESKFSHPNFGNSKFTNRMDGRVDSKIDNSRLDNRLPLDNSRAVGLPAHGPIGAAIKSSTPPRTSHFFSNNTTNDSDEQQPNLDDQAFASIHLDSSLQQSIAQTSSLHPLPPSTSSLDTFAANNMGSINVQTPPTGPAFGTGRVRDPSNIPTTELDVNIYGTWYKNMRAEKDAGWEVYQKTREEQQLQNAEQRKREEGTTYTVWRVALTRMFIERFEITVWDDGRPKRETMVTRVPNTPEHMKKVVQSQAEHPEDHTISATITPPARGPLGGLGKKVQPIQSSSQTAVTHAVILDSPPPADVSSHPVFDGADLKVVVRMPKQKVTVKLPPTSAPVQKSMEDHAKFAPQQGKSQAMVNKIQSLFSRKPAEVESAQTKSSYDVTTDGGSLTVNSFASDKAEEETTKPSADDILFEQPDHGSLPKVNMPKQPHLNHRFGYSHLMPNMSSRPNSRLLPKLEPQSVKGNVDAWLFGSFVDEQVNVTIRLPGMIQAKSVELPTKRSAFAKNNNNPSFRRPFVPKNNSGRGGSFGASNPPRNNKPRKPSGASPTGPAKPRGNNNWGPRPSTTN